MEIPIDEQSYTVNELENFLPNVITGEGDNIGEIDVAPKNEIIFNAENVNLLIVEDNEDILFTLKNILQRRYNVFTAENGVFALNIIKSNDIDIIVSDVVMPQMDGIKLCRTIKGNIETSHISVLLLTAKNSVEDRIECYDAGADGYISKPFEMKVLESRINNFLVKKKQKQTEFKSDVELNISTLDEQPLDEQFLSNAVSVIEEHITETDFDINSFAENMNMSKSSLYRKIKTMTGLPPNEFIRNIRLKHACLMMKDKSITISETPYAMWFSDPHYFTRCFKATFGRIPIEFQNNQFPSEIKFTNK